MVLVRWMPLSIHAADQNWLALSAAAYLSYVRVPPTALGQVVAVRPNSVQLTAQRIIPVDSSARMLINFFGTSNTFPAYSYRAVHDGEIDPAVFKDKIVLVGALNATGVTDRYFVPGSGANPMSGVEIYANALETLIQNQALVPQSRAAGVLILVIVSLGGGLLLTRLRWYGVLVASAGTAVVGFVGASLAFSVQRQVIPLLYPVMALALTGTGALISNIVRETQRRSQAQALLNSATRISEKRLVLTDTLHNIADDVTRLLNCKGSAIWLWDEDTHTLLPAFGRTTLLAPLALRVFTERKPINDADVLITPLIFQNRTLGTLAAFERTGGFGSAQQTLFRQLADQVAPAIDNARLYTRQLQQTDLLEAILTSTPDPVLVIDGAGALLRANQAAQALFTLDPHTAEPLEDVLKRAAISAQSNAALREWVDPVPGGNGSPPNLANLANLPNLEVILGEQTFIVRAARLQQAQSGTVLTFNDVSSLKELDTLKTQLIRMVSHDLKNPLSVVMGMAELLRDEIADKPDSDRPREYVQIIGIAAQQMLDIITDLLNIERMKAGRLDLETCDLVALVKQVTDEYTEQARAKHQTLMFTPPAESIGLEADQRQLHEAFSNLVGNALKYTPDGGTIRVTLTVALSEYAQNARIDVIDNGYGIPKAAQARLFTPFYRVPMRATRGIQGSGLGLSLVKAVIEAHRGRIWVESEEAQGSTFHVEIPITVPSADADTAVSITNPPGDAY